MHLLLAVLLGLPAILMFHQVDTRAPLDRVGRTLTVTPAQLGSELQLLEARGLRAVSVGDVVRAQRAHESTANMVILTFDDGYRDQYTDALPVLLQFGAHATFFITTGNVGKPNHLSWAQIRTMMRSGMEIGGHNVDHVDLASLSKPQQRHEIEGCLLALRLHTGIVPDVYAYPGGTFNRTTETILEREPIAYAFTTDASHELGVDARLEIPRIRVLANQPLQLAALRR